MRVRFWGVRGSLPTPLSSAQLRSKISAILERISPDDLESPRTRERFLAELPPWLFGVVGGNTPCVEVRTEGNEVLIFDAGTGIRELGVAVAKERPKPSRYRMFFSHLHWDHIQGLPFFGPAYDPSVSIDFHAPFDGLEAVLRDQMCAPRFPVGLDVMGAQKRFVKLNEPLCVGDAQISWRRMNHPGASYSYAVTEGVKRIVYATDTELSSDDFLRDDENAAFFGGADLIVIDAQYTLGEAIEKYSWGHSAFSLAADFASNWGIRKLVLFHHDPTYDDKKLYGILQSARWYIDHMSIKGVEVMLATEGTEIRI
ncbi:MAG: MBL fold metallo-hydrolase [Treponema sp. GWB1_62_6]|nr:MAG: MBL fold metallo-hydrolase [Treponema sp. GWA1_62_8]OHE65072.1 MAG: MBL fold metallo-hydrolase [Treponema sp. GWC1_61_84]OHE65184.1 MAG: MBL fold metallo-hydrolase [Treponema sp. GWB1_62_6]HCM26058.1 MBL fold metallo-hydrolase [Treponema sp.]